MGSHPNAAGTRSGAPTPSNILNSSSAQNAHIFTNDQQVRNIAQRMNTNPTRIPVNNNFN